MQIGIVVSDADFDLLQRPGPVRDQQRRGAQNAELANRNTNDGAREAVIGNNDIRRSGASLNSRGDFFA